MSQLPVIQEEYITLRCSSLPIIMACPGAAVPPEVPVREACEPATVGTVGHMLLEQLPENGRINFEEIPAVAKRYDLNEDELSVLCALGTSMWRELEGTFSGADTETSLGQELVPGFFLTGHADGLRLYGDVAHGWDWKLGRKDHDYSQQMMGYCALVLLTYPRLERVSFTVLWVRDRDIEGYSMTRDELPGWIRRVVSRVRDWTGQLETGHHCLYCPRYHECTGYQAMARAAIQPFANGSIEEMLGSIEQLPGAEQVDLFERAKTVAAIADRLTQTLRREAIKAGVIKGDGVNLVATEQRRRKVDTESAWPVLQDHLTDDELASVVHVRLSEAEKIVAKKAGRGKGKAAKEALSEQLDAAGAISYTSTHVVGTRRA